MNTIEGTNDYKINILLNNELIDISRIKVTYLKLNESVNNQIPLIEIRLLLFEFNILNLLTDNNFITILLSSNTLDYKKELLCSISSSKIVGQFQNTLELEILGVYYNLFKYITNNEISMYSGFAIDQIKKILNKYSLDILGTNLKGVSQNWINYNLSDKEFIDHILENSIIDDNSYITLLGLMTNGTAIIKTINELISEKPIYTWISNSNKKTNENKNYIYKNIEYIKSNNSLLHKFYGFNTSINTYNYTESRYIKNNNNFIIKNLNFSGNDTELFHTESIKPTNVTSNNVHLGFSSSKLKYETVLNQLSNIELVISFEFNIYPFKLLDKILLFNPDFQIKNLPLIEGNYIITGIDTLYFNGLISYFYRLNRDAFNKGNT